jgi:hypothetical protein
MYYNMLDFENLGHVSSLLCTTCPYEELHSYFMLPHAGLCYGGFSLGITADLAMFSSTVTAVLPLSQVPHMEGVTLEEAEEAEVAVMGVSTSPNHGLGLEAQSQE